LSFIFPEISNLNEPAFFNSETKSLATEASESFTAPLPPEKLTEISCPPALRNKTKNKK